MNLESLTFIKRIIEIALFSYEKASADTARSFPKIGRVTGYR